MCILLLLTLPEQECGGSYLPHDGRDLGALLTLMGPRQILLVPVCNSLVFTFFYHFFMDSQCKLQSYSHDMIMAFKKYARWNLEIFVESCPTCGVLVDHSVNRLNNTSIFTLFLFPLTLLFCPMYLLGVGEELPSK